MSAEVTVPAREGRTPAQQALLAGLPALAVTGGAVLYGVLRAPVPDQVMLALTGGAVALALAAAVAVAAYYAGAARRSGEWLAQFDASGNSLGQQVAVLTEQTLPAVVQRLRAGAPVPAVLAGVPRPADAGLDRLLQAVAHEVSAGVSAGVSRVAIQDDAARLADETVPAVVRQVRAGEPVEAVLATAAHPADPALDRVLQAAARGVEDADRRGAAALAGCAGAAARVQAQTTRMLAGLRELEDQYSEEKVFADLLDLDHQVSQLDRLADSMALLSGGRSGRRWTRPIVMESILRGALGRIAAYRQVRVHSASTLAVAGAAAEGVMHALAEILDNATSFSAPGSEVQVYVQEEDTGVVILVEDAGLGLRGPERHRAESLVAGSADLSTLPDGRLGLAAVGRLAASYGLTVSFRPSSRGGTAALLMIPHKLLTHPRLEDPEPPGPAVADASPAAAPDSAGAPRLPKRARGKALLSVAQPPQPGPAGGPDPEPGAEPAGPAPDPGPRFAAFRQAVHGASPEATAGPDRSAP